MTDFHDPELRLDIFRKAVELMEEAGLDASLMEDYSGRAMYGAQTPAVVSTEGGPTVGYFITIAALQAVGEVLELDHEATEMVRLLLPKRWDNLAMSTVYY